LVDAAGDGGDLKPVMMPRFVERRQRRRVRSGKSCAFLKEERAR
jgi:hypothetical protein